MGAGGGGGGFDWSSYRQAWLEHSNEELWKSDSFTNKAKAQHILGLI